MYTKWLIVCVGILSILLVVLVVYRPTLVSAPIQKITSFEECKNAGYPVMESYPEQCRAPSGEVFVRSIENQNEKPVLASTSSSISFDSPVTLHPHEKIIFSDGLEVTLQEINDSRCKPDVQCIWAGELSAFLSITNGTLGTDEREMYLGTINNTSRTLYGYVFTLVNATTTDATIIISKIKPVETTAQGFVTGHITIGPLCPVESIDHPCVVPSETYTSRNVVVYAPDKATVIKKTSLDTQGNYTVPLPVGTYWIQIQPAGIGEGEKKKVTIVASQSITVNFDIDTGIR